MCFVNVSGFSLWIFLERRPYWRGFFLSLSIFYAISGILTGSRTGIGAFILLLLSIPIIISASETNLGKTRRIALSGIPFLVLAFGFVFYPYAINSLQNVPLGNGFQRLFINLRNIGEGGLFDGTIKDNYRILQYIGAWILIWKAPLGGWGPGGFYREFPNEYYLQIGDLTSRNDSALNHYLMIAGDLGIPMLTLNLLIILLPLIAICRAFKRTKEKNARYILSVLFAIQFIFLFVINTLPPSYFPDVIWVWTAQIAVSLVIAQKYGVNFHISRERRRVVLPAIFLLIIFPNCLGIYKNTFGANGYMARQDALWNPLKFEKNCYGDEKWKEGTVRWCKGKTILKIPVTGTKSFPERIQIKFIVMHPDIQQSPVVIKYGGKMGVSGQISVSDKSWHAIEIPITTDDTIVLPALPGDRKGKFYKYFHDASLDDEGLLKESIANNFFFHGYKFSHNWTVPETGIYKYVVVSFEVSRNWVPKKWGINNDPRELGAAVLIPKL